MTKKEMIFAWTDRCCKGEENGCCHQTKTTGINEMEGGEGGGCVAGGGGSPQAGAPNAPSNREWNNQLDFLFSCISVSVGLGNVWRFPYLCYKNGGGIFLVTYFIAMVFCGIPMFFQEVAIGQYLRSGGMTLVEKICPILGGTGYSTMMIVFLLDIYYCIIVAWTLFYLFTCFVPEDSLPWGTCGHWWNSETCSTAEVIKYLNIPTQSSVDVGGPFSINVTINSSSLDEPANTSLPEALIQLKNVTTPVEEFWENRVLMISNGVDDWSGMQWELLYLLIIAWAIIYNILHRGLSESGKVIWFTALFPYVIMLALFVRAVTLPGATEGLKFLVIPDWSKLTDAGTWIDGITQIFFGYSIGVGTLPALGSYNRFNHNCYRDATITCIINTLTCLVSSAITFGILGHLADQKGVSVAEVVNSGPGLVFITYPEVVLKLPAARLWSIVFFVMLLILGLDSEFCNVESFITGVADKWPHLFQNRRRAFTFWTCVTLCFLGIPMVARNGMYLFQLMDFYAASGISLLWVCFFQTIAISWIFGTDKFCSCVEEMMGFRPSICMRICWTVLAPAVMVGILIFYLLTYTPLKYGDYYEYPAWGEWFGLSLCFISMVWIPLYALYFLAKTPGTLSQRLKAGMTPQSDLTPHRAKVDKIQIGNTFAMSESSVELLESGHL
ncbi:unnamed protein product [Bemisia tabaci]|uniref:Transporter n=1 Tax=Bemisia tabaci TaxID=7038 RepID=A0A9P0A0R6_BEMTA|nr:unnamed protein product [Bemisia tabaci]